MQLTYLKITIYFLFSIGFLNPILSQKDIPNSKDSELISRFPDSWIIGFAEKEYDRYTVAMDNTFPKGKSKTIEGTITSIDYELPKGKSQLELHKNYEDALKGKGFNILYSCYQADCNPVPGSFSSVVYSLYQAKKLPKLAKSGNTYRKNGATYLVAEKEASNQTTTVVVMSGFANYASTYRLDIIESNNMGTGLITVKDMDDRLKEKGSVVFYDILFDFNKTTLQPESSEAIGTIADYLNRHSKVSIYIVGHTDNVGNFQNNLALSEGRAKAVMQELIEKHGISKSRLEAKGVAMLSPVATNDNEEGRKLNRRVEIVMK
ncbi:DUF4892 domain-containing protein [Flagellimonas meridianipacifica]|uniref:Outer membrane protein OmpA-like peptidoglycan-associated protein n=1 Tax=Flagellimonas meridianipacifica TaxID=1080225 RepID=A0A2T0MIH6_9FLAO|nr:DUF4892 domain-containing protein [Allomuricauda pacifica]PRX57388.1 outer membrane protein OmpA-like peptidoglycan-associated protein [Allomuricauda pacifica]